MAIAFRVSCQTWSMEHGAWVDDDRRFQDGGMWVGGGMGSMGAWVIENGEKAVNRRPDGAVDPSVP